MTSFPEKDDLHGVLSHARSQPTIRLECARHGTARSIQTLRGGTVEKDGAVIGYFQSASVSFGPHDIVRTTLVVDWPVEIETTFDPEQVARDDERRTRDNHAWWAEKLLEDIERGKVLGASPEATAALRGIVEASAPEITAWAAPLLARVTGTYVEPAEKVTIGCLLSCPDCPETRLEHVRGVLGAKFGCPACKALWIEQGATFP